MYNEWEGTPWAGELQTRSDSFLDLPTIEQQITTIQNRGQFRPWRKPSVAEALSVPAIQRAVSLIANTTGSLSVQGWRNGVPMPESPRVVVRPDPDQTPRDSYRDMAYCMATRGETILWIANRDSDGRASALVVVPLAEITVEENPRSRRFPIYTWGIGPDRVKSTRYSGANTKGDFVHITYLKEPGQLRGKGPLQLCGAATSVSVEAQEWAANFYAEGGYPSLGVKIAGETDTPETKAFKAEWIDTPNNVTRFYNSAVEEIQEFGTNPQGAQMLDARDYQNGDAARMFGIPGALLEYGRPGSSLTYQNLAEVWTEFRQGCLSINYLEPIEAALTDVLSRSDAARFNTKGLTRVDPKTRAEVYNILVPLGIMTVEEARQDEGLAPGDVEFAPVPFAPPNAVPTSLPQVRSVPEPVRCDGLARKRRSGVTKLETCGKLIFPGMEKCPGCKKPVNVPAA